MKSDSDPVHSQTLQADRVSFNQKLLYSISAIAWIPAMQIIDRAAQIVLNMGLGIKPTTVGLAMMVFRIWDGFFDMYLGNVSDNFRSRFGRRRPFIVTGAVLCAITFPILWMMSPEWSETAKVAFFIVTGLFYYTGLAIYTIPYFSLANEMTPDTHERTNILAFRQVPANLVTIALGYLPMFLAWNVFPGPLNAIRWAAVATSVAFITFGMLPILFVKEPFYERASHQEQISLKESFIVTIKSKLFVNLVGMKLLMTLGMQTVGTLGYYISVYYVVGGRAAEAGKIAGHGGLLAMALATASVPLVALLTKRLGKIQALFLNGMLFLVATLLQWFMITPAHPYWQLVTAAILGPVVTAIWIVLPSMQADVIDADELETGRRREGAFSAVLAWIEKLGFAASVLLGGLILDVSGFDVKLPQQTEETLLRMRVLFVTFPIAMAGGMLWLLKSYPLTEKRVLEIRAELERRRGVVHTN